MESIMLESLKDDIEQEYYMGLGYWEGCKKINFESELEKWFFMKFDIFSKLYIGEISIFNFAYQYKINDYIVDFYYELENLKLIIEIDGFKYHDRNQESFQYERERQNYFISNGYTILRYTYLDIRDKFLTIYHEITTIIEHKMRELKNEVV